MRELWMIGAAGALGAMARYGLSSLVQSSPDGGWPTGTFVVNLLGCLLLGLVVEFLHLRDVVDRELGVALTVGFLGAFTTFSTFSLETVRLMERGESGVALLYVASSALVGCALCFAGMRISKTVWAA